MLFDALSLLKSRTLISYQKLSVSSLSFSDSALLRLENDRCLCIGHPYMLGLFTLANQKSQRSYSSRRLFFPAEGFPSIYPAVLRTLINGGKRKKYFSQYPLENFIEVFSLSFSDSLRLSRK